MNWNVKSQLAMNKSKTRQVNPEPIEMEIPSDKPNLMVKKDESTVEWKPEGVRCKLKSRQDMFHSSLTF